MCYLGLSHCFTLGCCGSAPPRPPRSYPEAVLGLVPDEIRNIFPVQIVDELYGIHCKFLSSPSSPLDLLTNTKKYRFTGARVSIKSTKYKGWGSQYFTDTKSQSNKIEVHPNKACFLGFVGRCRCRFTANELLWFSHGREWFALRSIYKVRINRKIQN